MILDSLAQADRYLALHPRFSAAFAFLRRPDLERLEPGRHDIEGEHLFAIISKGPGRSRQEAPLECHRRYIDIQFVVSGSDEMGWQAAAACRRPSGDYDPKRDIRFFEDAPASWITVGPGDFCIFFPDDAHAPLISAGEVHKIVVKIAV